MHKRKSKPDLLFLLTVIVCLGVLVTATVNAEEKNGWGINLNTETDCNQVVGSWSTCSRWQAVADHADLSPRRATVNLSSDENPDLGFVWYYTLAPALGSGKVNEFNTAADNPINLEQGQFGVAVKQQYRRFGFTLGIEAAQPNELRQEPLLYFGINNRW